MGHNTCKSMGRVLCVVRRQVCHVCQSSQSVPGKAAIKSQAND